LTRREAAPIVEAGETGVFLSGLGDVGEGLESRGAARPVSEPGPTGVPLGVKLTPMVQQYLEIKSRVPDAILFFRLGDFYEMFFEDAEVASRLLDLALTSRNKGEEGAVPLCGVPVHSARPYLQRLLEAGHKVAICEQVEDPATARGLVDRRIVRIVSPGTVLEEESLEPREPNYLAVVSSAGDRAGLAVVDLSTGELRAAEVDGAESLREELARLRPREVLVAEGGPDPAQLGAASGAMRAAAIGRDRFDRERFRAWFEARCGTLPPEWSEKELATAALGALLAVLEEQLVRTESLRVPESWTPRTHLVLDAATRRNLELVESLSGGRAGSLLGVLDRTATPMGARQLRQWLLYPLLDPERIGCRLDAVEELCASGALRDDLGAALEGLGDLERLCGRIGSRTASPRDLFRLRLALERAERIRSCLDGVRSAALREAASQISPLPQLREEIRRALVDDPPAASRQGDLIREGYSPEVDELRRLRRDGAEWLRSYEAAERSRTGIASLKVRFNRVFGYYLEVTKPNLSRVPPEYRRKQTIAGGERFVTPELEQYEARVLGAEERLRRLEAALFEELLEAAASHLASIVATASALARIDAFRSLAEVAVHYGYVRPAVDLSRSLEIRDGRHPVVERMLPPGRFVPNDLRLDPDAEQVAIVTGPNMAGKSTYLRQTALIVLLAQIGSFVPASAARIGIVDRIFTRVGASDDLAAGDSTFMVEMKETARILTSLTDRSLVLLDEIGRGTSTFDGISIAWAVAEFLHDAPQRPKTLFATHFHELTEITATAERARNFSVAVKEWRDEVLFLRRIVPGPASQSYGIHVARLAGVPQSVIDRAREILANLERGEREEGPKFAARPGRSPAQLSLFGDRGAAEAVVAELRSIDPLVLTPLEALQRLHELVEKAKG
jgi:DNA mismatch repair protein MutS